jgi:hypothetical protein
MGSELMRTETSGSYRRMNAKGFTLIASLMMLLLLSGIAIGLMMMVNTEGKVGGTDLQNNIAYHSAEGGVEKMTSDLAAVFQTALAPKASQICGLGLPSNTGPALTGVTWKEYQITPGALGSACPTDAQLTALERWGQISSGPNQGLWAQIIPNNMLATASEPGGQEVSMTRSAQVALIPVFQFGVFSESDLSFYPGSNLDFTGPVHTNGDLYPFAGTGATLTFHSKLSAYGNVVRTQLPNGLSATANYNGTVYIPSSDGDCTTPGTAVTGNCTAMAQVQTNSGDGSVNGAGGNAAQSGANYNGSVWNAFSSSVNAELVNGNWGSTTTPGTGGKKLTMPFVGGGALPNEIVRRPPAGENATSSLGASREYNMAQIRVLLSDDPAELPGGASDTNNVRLANLSALQAQAQYGNSTAVAVNEWGIPIASGNYSTTHFGSPTGSNTYNLYFAAASNVVPIASTCTTSASCSMDWPYAPLSPFGGNPYPSQQGLQPAPPSASAPAAPTYQLPSLAGLATGLCPPSSPAIGSGVVVPSGCPGTPAYPFFAPPNPSGATNYASQYSSSWSLVDGYLRVEYKDTSGNWNPVTNEWLQLGFARGLTPPTAPQSNPITPNAILLLQEPADRDGSGALSSGGTAPTCTNIPSSGTNKNKCIAWSGVVPEIVTDVAATAAGINPAGTLSAPGEWAFGLTQATPVATPAASATPHSLTQFNWYPINFYDAREGEVRDNTVADNSCSINGVMNAVEIDVGNLAKWLAGTIPGSGSSVDFNAQNGYILYFSDRRGMLLNPHPPLGGAQAKTGDAGLEDVINRSSGVGQPDGVLDTKPANRSFSPEDDNENGFLDNFGTANLGLGFWNDATHNLNVFDINNPANPDPFGTTSPSVRIAACATTARKNWVSGARHVLRLVDGSLGNVPRRTDAAATLDSPGGFTVASENPVYIWGDYNTNAADAGTWASDTNKFDGDQTGHSAAAVISDAVTLLSVDWLDNNSLIGNATTLNQRNPSHDGYFRLAIAGGKNMNFQQPTYSTPAAPGQDFGTDGGVHNFLRYLETWGGQTVHYKGSLVSLFYSTYNTGTFKCCTVVYGVPVRSYYFDLDFSTPGGLPPGTPMFRDVNSLSYRQLFSARPN